MKNVILVISLVINCAAMAIAAKFWTPIKEILPSQKETKVSKTENQESNKPDSAKMILKEAILAQRSEMENCYDDYLRREPSSVNGSVLVKWFIDTEGAAQSPTIAESEIQDDLLKNCVLENVSKMVFDPKKFAENTQFSYRFNFRARTPGSIKFE